MFAFSLAFLKRMNILEVIYVPSASAQTPSATARNSEGFTSVHSERISGAATGMLLPLEAIWRSSCELLSATKTATRGAVLHGGTTVFVW